MGEKQPMLVIRLLLDGDVTEEKAEHVARRIFEQAFNDETVIAGDYSFEDE